MADRAMLALAIIAFVLCVVAIAAAFTEFHLEQFAAYNRWANARLYEAALSLDDAEYRRNVGAFFKCAQIQLSANGSAECEIQDSEVLV
jgi:hypothetical protein